MEPFQYLMEYAKENNIILNVNDKNNDGNYPFLVTLKCHNYEKMKILMDYAKENYITLEIHEGDN